jgi:secreted trypsin-like serine protease
MKTFLRLLAAAVAAAALGVTPALAVIGGSPDGNAHPYVGMSVFFDSQGNTLWRCSGFLVSPTVYVTAAHCAGPETPGAPQPAFAGVWFGSGPISHSTPPDVLGVPVANPQFNGNLPDHDIGIVRLATPVTDRGYATLAPLGYLDALAKKRGQQNVSFTIVGYGVEDYGPNGLTAVPLRSDGTVQMETLQSNALYTTASNGNGTGGSATCLGDSGGPIFNGGYVVALVSGGTKYCNGKAADFRVDTAEAQNFIASAGS